MRCTDDQHDCCFYARCCVARLHVALARHSDQDTALKIVLPKMSSRPIVKEKFQRSLRETFNEILLCHKLPGQPRYMLCFLIDAPCAQRMYAPGCDTNSKPVSFRRQSQRLSINPEATRKLHAHATESVKRRLSQSACRRNDHITETLKQPKSNKSYCYYPALFPLGSPSH